MERKIAQMNDVRKQRLMRCGFTVTGLGLVGFVVGCGCLAEGPLLPIAALVAILCGGLAAIVIGFGMMVVAADPFADDETWRDGAP